MDRPEIEARLRLTMGTLCLAAMAGKTGDLTEARTLLVDEVVKLVREAERKTDRRLADADG